MGLVNRQERGGAGNTNDEFNFAHADEETSDGQPGAGKGRRKNLLSHNVGGGLQSTDEDDDTFYKQDEDSNDPLRAKMFKNGQIRNGFEKPTGDQAN